MKILKWVDKALMKFEGWLIISFLSVMVSLTFIQVVLRGLYTHAHLAWANSLMGQLDWSEPFVRLLVLWLTFLGASLLTRENKHIKIDLLTPLIPPSWLPLRGLILSLVCILISFIMLTVCIEYIEMEMTFGENILFHFPGWIGQIILPGGFAAILFRFSLRAIALIIEIVGASER